MTFEAHPGTLRRVTMKFERDFTQMPNNWLRDRNLSRGARGILAELMTHADGFEVSLTGLVARGPEGKDAIRRMVGELEKFGYLIRQRSREGGKFKGTVWTLTDPWEAPTYGGFPDVGKTDVGQTDVGQTGDGKPATKNTNLKNNLNTDFPNQPSVVDGEPVDNSLTMQWQTETCPAAWNGSRAHSYSQQAGKCSGCAETPLRWGMTS